MKHEGTKRTKEESNRLSREILPIHQMQLLTYLRLTGKWLGLLLDFNVSVLRQGIQRVVNWESLMVFAPLC